MDCSFAFAQFSCSPNTDPICCMTVKASCDVPSASDKKPISLAKSRSGKLSFTSTRPPSMSDRIWCPSGRGTRREKSRNRFDPAGDFEPILSHATICISSCARPPRSLQPSTIAQETVRSATRWVCPMSQMRRESQYTRPRKTSCITASTELAYLA